MIETKYTQVLADWRGDPEIVMLEEQFHHRARELSDTVARDQDRAVIIALSVKSGVSIFALVRLGRLTNSDNRFVRYIARSVLTHLMRKHRITMTHQGTSADVRVDEKVWITVSIEGDLEQFRIRTKYSPAFYDAAGKAKRR